MKEPVYLRASAESSLREVEAFGDKYLVVPVVALVEGVIHASTSPIPELVMATEFVKSVDAWAGKPLCIDHPVLNGTKVSASHPKVAESYHVGTVYKPEVDGNKLKMEAWICLSRVEKLGKHAQALVAALRSGEMIEVSTGYFADSVPATGKFNECTYESIQKNIFPDHLALLTSEIGACSIGHGCGAPRINTILDGAPEIRYNQGMERCRCDLVRLLTNEIGDTDKARILQKAIRDAYKTAGGDGYEHYVVAVFDEYVIHDGPKGLMKCEYTLDEDGTVTFTGEPVPVRAETQYMAVKPPILEDNEMTKDERIKALAAKFAKGKDTKWLAGLPDDAILLLEESLKPVGEIHPILPVEPVAPPAPVVAPPAMVALPATGALPVPPVALSAQTLPSGAPPVAPVVVAAAAAPTAEQYVANAPAEVREVLEFGLGMQRARRTDLVGRIKANSRNKFTDPELAKLSMTDLERIAALASTADIEYSGLGGPISNSASDNDVPDPIPLWKN